MFQPIKVIDVELSNLPDSIDNIGDYSFLQVLVRLHGSSIGYVRMPVINGSCSVQDLISLIIEKHNWAIVRHLLCDWLAELPRLGRINIEDVINASHQNFHRNNLLPFVTVVICTRDHSDDLATCLDSINNLDYPNLDIVVVDNAPSNDATYQLVNKYNSKMRYIRELRPGLNWARNRAIAEARGEIIAFTDDDVVVDRHWVRSLVAVFAEDPGVAAVTGLVAPYELETRAQELFEQYGGFGRGFIRSWNHTGSANGGRLATIHGGPGKFGTGANMAFRRSLFKKIGLFDPALDVGTITNGGGDLEMFFRVLKEGYALVYEPNAIVRHRHRRDYASLRTQIANWGIGFSSYLVSSALTYPDERSAFLKLWLRWVRKKLRSALLSHLRPMLLRDLFLAELTGLVKGTLRYHKARSTAEEITATFGPISPTDIEQNELGAFSHNYKKFAAVRTVDLAQSLRPLEDITDYSKVHILITWKEQPLGKVEISTYGQPVSRTRLREAIVDRLRLRLLDPDHSLSDDSLWSEMRAALRKHYMRIGDVMRPVFGRQILSETTVSIVVATYDRPDDLRNCLQCLLAQKPACRVEIIVVDNNPSSGKTPSVVNEFPEVKLVSEPRKGLSYARNKGIAMTTGDIIITTDDDVTMPPDWLEKLIAPFARRDVMVVTGNVLPGELETRAQHLFEAYGGLGRGFMSFEADRRWFESGVRHAVPTWRLGSTANAAFRAVIFSDPEIGLMDEALGAGTPTGCSEDTYLFYKVLKAGYTILYEPQAYVWHKHRQTMTTLRKQIYNYSKGHVSYHLRTLVCDHDLRALSRLFIELPRYHVQRIKGWLLGRRTYPLSLTLLEIAGNLMGPFALCRSIWRVRREGHSEPYVLPSARRLSIMHPQPNDRNLSI
ncbi:MAG: glycosyltransferase [Nitrospirota bacterium]